MKSYDVIIAGGGYAGVMCALRLAALRRGTGARIALASPLPRFVERLRLHEGLVARAPTPLRSFDLGSFLAARGVTNLQGKVLELDRTRRIIEIVGADGERQANGYGRLVLALGSEVDLDAIAGAREHAYALEPTGARGAQALRRRLARLSHPRVLVIGGGATGTEVAAEIAQKPGAAVTLVDSGTFGGFTTPPVARRIRAELDRAGVTVLENARVLEVGPDAAKTTAGEIAFDVCVANPGFAVPRLVAASGLQTSTNGRVLVNECLQSLSDPYVLAAGDCAETTACRGAPPRMSVFYALCTGAHAARSVSDLMRGKAPKAFGFWTYGQAIGLGRSAVGFANFPNDRPLPPYYTGRTGYHLRRFFVWLLFRLLVLERAMPGLPFYLGPPARRVAAGEAETA